MHGQKRLQATYYPLASIIKGRPVMALQQQCTWSGDKIALSLQRYITRDEVVPGIPAPAVLEVPEHFKRDPHKFIAQLNSGALPYQLAGKPTLFHISRQPVNSRHHMLVVCCLFGNAAGLVGAVIGEGKTCQRPMPNQQATIACPLHHFRSSNLNLDGSAWAK